MTYSVVAHDPRTNELGLAVASCVLAVGGPLVPWSRGGVGVVLTQARPVRSYGVRALAALAEGAQPEQVLDRLLSDDPEPQSRQIAVLDAMGRIAVHTGQSCLPVSAHQVGAGWSVQGNMLASPDVVPAMAMALRDTAGSPLAEQLIAALVAGEAAGGDVRGRQSAAMRIVSTRPSRFEGDGVVVDLRVDDADDPIGQLRVLWHLQRAHAASDWETLSVFAPVGARDLYSALAAAARGDRDTAREALAALAERPGWSDLLSEYAQGRMPNVRELLNADAMPDER